MKHGASSVSPSELDQQAEGMPLAPLGAVLAPVDRKRRAVKIRPHEKYTTLTVRLYARGIVQRETLPGSRIGTKTLYQVQAGDFVFSKIDARNGAWGFVPPTLEGGLVSGDFPILSLKTDVADQSFVHWAMSRPSAWEPLRDLAVGTTNRRRIQVAEFLRAPIPLPPLQVQRAIAHVLDTVQRAREATERVLAAAQELKRSLMRYLFTYGPVPLPEAGQVPLKETVVGPLPEHWEVVPLGDVVTVSTGTTPSTSTPEYYEGNTPFVRTGEINETAITGTTLHVSEEAIARYRLKTHDAGTVLLAMYGQGQTRGRTAILGIAACITQNTAALRCGPLLDPVYLWFYLMYRYSHLRSSGAIGQISHLNLGYVRVLPLPLPPKDEQAAIRSLIAPVLQKCMIEESLAQALEHVLQALLHEITCGIWPIL